MIKWENGRIIVTEASDFMYIECTERYCDEGVISEIFRCYVDGRGFGLKCVYPDEKNAAVADFKIIGPSIMDINLNHDEIIHLRAALFSSAQYYIAENKIEQANNLVELSDIDSDIFPPETAPKIRELLREKALEFNRELSANWSISDMEDALFELEDVASSSTYCAIQRTIERLKELREFQFLVGTPQKLKEVLNELERYKCEAEREEER